MAFDGADAGAGDLATGSDALAAVVLPVCSAACFTAVLLAGFFAVGWASGAAVAVDAFTGASAFLFAGAWALLSVDVWAELAAGVKILEVLGVVFMTNDFLN